MLQDVQSDTYDDDALIMARERLDSSDEDIEALQHINRGVLKRSRRWMYTSGVRNGIAASESHQNTTTTHSSTAPSSSPGQLPSMLQSLSGNAQYVNYTKPKDEGASPYRKTTSHRSA